MRELCHRCHGELPASIQGDSPLIFCPHCAAPQLLLSESLRIELPAVAPTTGALPPPRPTGSYPLTPRPGQVDWRAAIAATGLVAAVSAVLLVGGLEVSALSFLSVLWTMSGAAIALVLYSRSRPQAWMDARIGLRVGFASGLLMIAAMSIALAGTGVVMRYGTHSLGNFDADWEKQLAHSEAISAQWFPTNAENEAVQQKLHGMFNSPEGRAGTALIQIGFQGSLLILLSTGGGAFAGMLRASRSPRPGLRRGD